MKLSQALLIWLLLIQAAFASSLSTNNCPDGFSVSNANMTSSSSSAAVDFLFSGMYSSSTRAEIQAGFSSGNTSNVSAQLLSMQVVVPFGVVGFAFLVTFIVALACCVCEKSCPPCKSWQRNFATRPFTKPELKCVTIFAIIFALGIVITSIIAFVYLPKLEEDVSDIKCSLYLALDVAQNGDLTNGWGGFTSLNQQIGTISDLLSDASTKVSTYLNNKEWLVTSMDALQEQNINIYKDNNESTVYSPNPITTQSAISGGTDLPTVTPLFISSGLGPNGTSNTMVTDIDQGIRVTEQLSNQGYKAYTAAQLFAHSSNTITANLNKANATLSANSNYLTSIQVSLNSFNQVVFDKVFNWGLYLVQAVIGLILTAGLIMLLGVFAVHCFDFYTCRTSVHLGWIAFGITYFGIVFMTFLFFTIGALSYQFCQFYASIITNQASFAVYGDATGKSEFNRLFSKLDTCLYGDGNIMSAFNIKQETGTVSNLYSEINTFLNMRDSSTSQYIDMTYSTGKISGWMAAMLKYKEGIYVDANPSLTTEENPQIALQGMNKYTNNGTNGSPPSCTNDYWVFDSANCTYNSTEAVYPSSEAPDGYSFVSTGTLCIPFNSHFESTRSDSWTSSDISLRYVSKRQCEGNTQTYTNIIKYAQSLVNYRDSRVNLYTNLYDQLDSLLTSNTNFNQDIIDFTTNVNDFVTQTNQLNTQVTHATTGLDVSSNCTTIGNHLRMINNVFCKRFIYTSVQFGICCLVLMALMIGGTLTGAVFATRYGRIQHDQKLIRPQTPSLQQLHSQTFQKRNQSNSSSSSSSDED